MKHIKQLILGAVLGIALPFSTIQAVVDHEALYNISKEAGDTALHVAVKQNDICRVRVLLKNGADHTILNADGKTPVDCICPTGKFDHSFDPFNYLDVEMKKVFREHGISVIDPSEYDTY